MPCAVCDWAALSAFVMVIDWLLSNRTADIFDFPSGPEVMLRCCSVKNPSGWPRIPNAGQRESVCRHLRQFVTEPKLRVLILGCASLPPPPLVSPSFRAPILALPFPPLTFSTSPQPSPSPFPCSALGCDSSESRCQCLEERKDKQWAMRERRTMQKRRGAVKGQSCVIAQDWSFRLAFLVCSLGREVRIAVKYLQWT